MIKCEKNNDFIKLEMQGNTEKILVELEIILKNMLNTFSQYNQELLVLDTITDVVSEFADDKKTNSKGEKNND